MEAVITSFRRSKRVLSSNQMILRVGSIENKDKASKLVGKEVSWKSSAGNEIKGKISAVHGGNGAVRVIFERGMPGQSLGTKVSIK